MRESHTNKTIKFENKKTVTSLMVGECLYKHAGHVINHHKPAQGIGLQFQL
jgi:hypothetical protein